MKIATEVRNALLRMLTDAAGTEPKLEIVTEKNVVLADFRLPRGWAGMPAEGQVDLAGMPWICLLAPNGGRASHYRMLNGNGCVWEGPVTGKGGGGELELQNTEIVKDQTVRIVAWSIVAPGA